uniref:G-protein coupled receptors family 1 profile domain-containing protein n=1 Tax=Vespula pensylvanica TaxID=30213 RepID=A0A834U9G9_VESPE|nr:hypothetical protein H0235_008857 [Vespula pensylvanica]
MSGDKHRMLINSRWSLGPELCDIWTSSDVLCCTASILHLVAIAVDRYWAVTDLNYTQGRSPKKIGFLIAMVWIVSLGISMAPHFGWKDPDYLERIAEGECLVSQDPAYQNAGEVELGNRNIHVVGTHTWRHYQTKLSRVSGDAKERGVGMEGERTRGGWTPARQREESTAFTITRSTPDHSSISPEKSSSYNDGNVVQSTVVNITPRQRQQQPQQHQQQQQQHQQQPQQQQQQHQQQQQQHQQQQQQHQQQQKKHQQQQQKLQQQQQQDQQQQQQHQQQQQQHQQQQQQQRQQHQQQQQQHQQQRQQPQQQRQQQQQLRQQHQQQQQQQHQQQQQQQQQQRQQHQQQQQQ